MEDLGKNKSHTKPEGVSALFTFFQSKKQKIKQADSFIWHNIDNNNEAPSPHPSHPPRYPRGGEANAKGPLQREDDLDRHGASCVCCVLQSSTLRHSKGTNFRSILLDASYFGV